MLKQRIVTALILLVFALVWLFFCSDFVFSIISLGVCVIGFYELLEMYKFSVIQKIVALFLIIVIAVAIYGLKCDFSQELRAIATIFWCFLVPVILALQPKSFSKIIIVIFGVIIFILAFYALSILKLSLGGWQLLSIMAIAWIADTGAYFVGRNFGQHKLASNISPGKSVEGAIGGGVLVLLYLFLLKYFAFVSYLHSYTAVIKFTLILVIVSVIGDLFESWLKRVAKVKDSGNILPGHGGVFDRIDSLVAVLAIAYAILYKLL